MVWPTGLRMEVPMAMLLLLDAFLGLRSACVCFSAREYHCWLSDIAFASCIFFGERLVNSHVVPMG
jgi:hypothetical protein